MMEPGSAATHIALEYYLGVHWFDDVKWSMRLGRKK